MQHVFIKTKLFTLYDLKQHIHVSRRLEVYRADVSAQPFAHVLLESCRAVTRDQ